MKIQTITILSLALVLSGVHQVQSKRMNPATGDVAMAQTQKTEEKAMGKVMTTNRDDLVPTDAELRSRLTPLQYAVTRQDSTEQPFANTYWNNHAAGIYVDVISGAPLFSSTDKYQSGTGWPSFTQPLEADNILEKEDRGLFSVRTEIRSKLADSHLGHVFTDGPAPDGLRYCMNSAALRFVAKSDLEKEGYAEYLKLFK